jgi:hypothetical protein
LTNAKPITAMTAKNAHIMSDLLLVKRSIKGKGRAPERRTLQSL